MNLENELYKDCVVIQQSDKGVYETYLFDTDGRLVTKDTLSKKESTAVRHAHQLLNNWDFQKKIPIGQVTILWQTKSNTQ